MILPSRVLNEDIRQLAKTQDVEQQASTMLLHEVTTQRCSSTLLHDAATLRCYLTLLATLPRRQQLAKGGQRLGADLQQLAEGGPRLGADLQVMEMNYMTACVRYYQIMGLSLNSRIRGWLLSLPRFATTYTHPPTDVTLMKNDCDRFS